MVRNNKTRIPVSYDAEFRKYMERLSNGGGTVRPSRSAQANYADVADFADRLTRSKDAIRKMIRDHRIFALKIGGLYAIVIDISTELLRNDAIWFDPAEEGVTAPVS